MVEYGYDDLKDDLENLSYRINRQTDEIEFYRGEELILVNPEAVDELKADIEIEVMRKKQGLMDCL